MPSQPPKRLYAGIAASAAAVLLLEIGLTRIFSYTIWYHFAYLTISVALLGFGGSGAVLAAWPRLRERAGFASAVAIAACSSSTASRSIRSRSRATRCSLRG
jgi:hypothetical protein